MAFWDRLSMLLRSEKSALIDRVEQGIQSTMEDVNHKLNHFQSRLKNYLSELSQINSSNWDEYFETYLRRIQEYWKDSFGDWFGESSAYSDNEKKNKHRQKSTDNYSDSYWRKKAEEDFSRGGTDNHSLKQHYDALEIPMTASVEEIKTAWKKAMRKYHPDLFHNDPQKKEIAMQLAARLTHAYQEIMRHLSQD